MVVPLLVVRKQRPLRFSSKPQENADDRVLNNVVCAGAHIDVGLVDQQDGVPAPGAQQGVPQILLHFRRTDPELGALQLVERSVVLLGEHLSRQGLAQTGIAFEQDQASPGLPGDDVAIFEPQGMPQHLEESAGVLGDHQVTVNVILVSIRFEVGDMGDDFLVPDQVVGVNQGMLRHFNLPALLIPLGDVCDLPIVWCPSDCADGP